MVHERGYQSCKTLCGTGEFRPKKYCHDGITHQHSQFSISQLVNLHLISTTLFLLAYFQSSSKFFIIMSYNTILGHTHNDTSGINTTDSLLHGKRV